ncbi:MAG: HAD-IC family P-type ATPase, partial [Clostridiales bacterium]|nr:HAD-IC family P-type ATPase [Clostridiales bacterium]
MELYQKSKEEVLLQVGSNRDGLDESTAAERLSQNGKNQLQEGKKKSLAAKVWEQIRDPMILVLIAAAIVSGAFGEIADMVIILIVVVLNAVLGIVQEGKAERAIEALQNMSAPYSKVRRSGSVEKIKSEDIVVGDIVLLEAGDSVPADMRILEAASLKIEEAALTGESVPAEKSADTLEVTEKEIPLADRSCMAYMGTSVVYGRCEGVVTATGMDTEMGKIAGILSDTQTEKTPLQQKLAGLSKVLSIGVLAICVVIFIINVLRGGGFTGSGVFDSLLTAISLAVAAIPEGLVVVVTVLLSIGVTKMSEKNAIVRRLTAVETLGCTQIVCSDKTGTLTQNKMTVVAHYGEEAALQKAMYLCNDAQGEDPDQMVGDPTETALRVFAINGGYHTDIPRAAEAPFDSQRKMMSTIHEIEGRFTQYTKGAPDEVLARCTTVLENGAAVPLTEERRQQILAQNSEMAGRALRVLGAACKTYDALPTDCAPEKLEVDMTFIGLCGMIDPVRPEVQKAIVQCRSAGIRPIMITGDHKDTAVAIAKELGILQDASQAITGAELSQMSDAEFEKRLGDIVVYARVQPEHKVRIVNAWKKRGKITAMTGDGVNDAPALKSADIGVGMGITGTDVTKNVADMVLADDNFATIVYAVEEGRRIYENIRKAIQFLLASNLSEVLSIFTATLAGLRLFAPVQILWI